MIHCTLNTGHSRESQRSEVKDESLEALADLLCDGRHLIPGLPGYDLVVKTEGTAIAPDHESADVLWPTFCQAYTS